MGKKDKGIFNGKVYELQIQRKLVIFNMWMHFIEKISVTAKRNMVLRLFCMPFIRYKRKILLKSFSESADGMFLKSMKKKYNGEKCFVLGNGPSLNISDINKLKNEYCFASNSILYLFDKTEWRPTFYLCTDVEGFLIIKDKLRISDVEYKFLSTNCKPYANADDGLLHYFFSYENFTLRKYAEYVPKFSDDISICVYSGHTITFIAIQMAVYMGFTDIYLLGCDHNYSKKINKNGQISVDTSVKTYAEGIPEIGLSLQYVSSTTQAYECAKKYCDEHGIKIYNATRGGKLEVFERVDFDSLFSDKTQEVQ